MRTSGAILLVIAICFVGFSAISYAGQEVPTSISNGSEAQSSDAYNLTTGVFEGTTQSIIPAITLGGIAVMIFAAIGYLVFVGPRGR